MLQPRIQKDDPGDHPQQPFGPGNPPFNAIGGEPGVKALVDSFYDHMHRDPRFAAIRSLHKPDLADARLKLFEFLTGWLGGPELYVSKYGHPRLRARHMPFSIGATERDLWLACMNLAMNDCRLPADLQSFLQSRFAHVADFMRNRPE